MKKLFRPSRIITGDEKLAVFRVGTRIPQDKMYEDGKPYPIHEDEFQIVCNVQPMNARDLLLVEEGDRYKEQYWVFTNKLQRPLADNDRVVRNCANYQVQSVEDWGSYIRARIMRYDVGASATP